MPSWEVHQCRVGKRALRASRLLSLPLELIIIRYLASSGCVKPICEMLKVDDSKTILVALEALEQLLKIGKEDAEANDGVNPYSVMIEEASGNKRGGKGKPWCLHAAML